MMGDQIRIMIKKILRKKKQFLNNFVRGDGHNDSRGNFLRRMFLQTLKIANNFFYKFYVFRIFVVK